MPRLTRAKAAEVAEQIHVDEDAILEENMKVGTPEPGDRKVLEDIAPNSAGSSKDEAAEVAQLKKSTRGRKAGKKGGKGKKDVVEQNDQAPQRDGTVHDETAGDLNVAEDAQPFFSRSSRSRAAKQEPGLQENATFAPDTMVVSTDEPLSLRVETTTAVTETAPPTALDAPASPLPTALPNVIASLRKDTPGRRTASNKENIEPMESPIPANPAALTPRTSTSYDALEAAAVDAATPPIGPSRRTSALDLSQTEPALVSTERRDGHVETLEVDHPKGPIEALDALDALDDAIEQVSAEMQQTKISEQKFKAKKAAPVVRTTKASQARISMAHPEKATIGQPRPSTLARASSVRQSTVNRPAPAANKRVLSTGNPKATATEPREKKEAVIPHSKPRPISLSFPTPPPPPKSKKAPTQSTFQLPGEAVAAKLKAAREERLRKEAEAPVEKRPAFKARPVPTMLKQAPSVRQTHASQARQSLMNGGKPATTTGMHKRAQSAVTNSTTAKPRITSGDASLRPPNDSLKVTKRPSTALANLGKPRSSIAPASGQRVPSAGKGTAKGKEVFNRAAAAKEAAEKEKREKDEAAKKARAAAAERGRQLSREWAEKQKAKKMAAAAAVGKGESAVAVEVATS